MDTQSTIGTAGSDLPSLTEIWARVFNQARREIDIPTVWLAMQAVQPLVIDGSFFVAALPASQKYLATNLQGFEASTVIEEALRTVTGRILAFHLIEGETLEDWQREKAKDPAAFQAAPPVFETPPAFEEPTFEAPAFDVPRFAAPPPPTPPAAQMQPSGNREVITSWDKLNEKLTHGYKTAPFIKYAHGQARYLLKSIIMISDTMDALMPPPGQPRDEAQERLLAKNIERFANVMSLDALFISLELMRYRQSQGKEPELL